MLTINTTTASVSPTLNKSPPAVVTPYEVFILVIGMLAVLLNGLLLIAMVRNASTIFTSNGAYLVANLAIADLLTGLNSSIWGFKNAFPFPRYLEIVVFSMFWTSIEASFLTISVMSLERYIAIVFPFTAEVLVSKARTIQSCVAVWILSGFCGVFMALNRAVVSFGLTLVFEITIFVTTILYYKIFLKLSQRKAHLASQLTSVGSPGNPDLRREYQLTTVVVVLTLILVITVLPYMIAGQIVLASRLFTSVRYPNLLVFLHYYLPVEIMNFALNPVVYAWRLQKYRYALLRTLQFGCPLRKHFRRFLRRR